MVNTSRESPRCFGEGISRKITILIKIEGTICKTKTISHTASSPKPLPQRQMFDAVCHIRRFVHLGHQLKVADALPDSYTHLMCIDDRCEPFGFALPTGGFGPEIFVLSK